MSITLTREALSCTLPNVSAKTAMLASGLTLTFLDAEGDYLGNWMPSTGAVYVTANEVGHASTANEAGTMLLAYEAPSTKAPKKASTSKAPVQATARTASTTTKESTMTTKPSLTSTNARIDALEAKIDTRLDRIEALMTGKAPAKKASTKAAPQEAPTAKAPTGKVSRCTAKTLAGKRCQRTGLAGKCGSHSEVVEVAKAGVKAGKKVTKAQAKAIVATKGSRAVAGGSGLSRSAWNKTLTTKARLAGKKGGVSVYSLVIANWSLVQTQRQAGLTPDDVLSSF